jgi:hypothetical protein
MNTSFILIDTQLKSFDDFEIIKKLWMTMCINVPTIGDIHVDYERSRIVNNIQQNNKISLQYSIDIIPDEYMVIRGMVSIIEEFFVKNNLSDALPISIRGMCECGSRIKIYNLI